MKDLAFVALVAVLLGLIVAAPSLKAQPKARHQFRVEPIRLTPGSASYLSANVGGFSCDQGQCYVLVVEDVTESTR